MRISLILSIFIVPQFVAAAQISVYSGQEVRSIKALSAEEIKGLENGDGMGFAKPAELNHYPGPKHVLDLADEHGLTLNQRAETQLLYQRMHESAVSLGQELVFEENTLEQLFSS